MGTFLHRTQFHSVQTLVKASKFHRKMLHSPTLQTQSVLTCRCLNPCLCLHLNNKAIQSISEVYWTKGGQYRIVLNFPCSIQVLSQGNSPSHLPSACSHTDYLLVGIKTTHPITSTNLVKAKASSQAVAKSCSLRTENFWWQVFPTVIFIVLLWNKVTFLKLSQPAGQTFAQKGTSLPNRFKVYFINTLIP